MQILKKKRQERDLSQRNLARRAGIAYKTLQLLESGRHDPRWSTLAKIVQALGCPEDSLQQALAVCLGVAEDSAAGTATKITEEGLSSWKLWLLNFADAFRRKPDVHSVSHAPAPEVPHVIQALLASTVEFLCHEIHRPIPWWCAGIPPLPEPWFVAGVENLKATALVESPAEFRQRNIFVLGNFLSRT